MAAFSAQMVQNGTQYPQSRHDLCVWCDTPSLNLSDVPKGFVGVCCTLNLDLSRARVALECSLCTCA